MRLWTYNGALVMRDGAAVLCEACPCEEPPEVETIPCSLFTARPPRYITLSFPGAANEDCLLCASELTAPHTLEFDPLLSEPNVTGCHWRKVLSPGNCAYTTLDVHVRLIGLSVLIEAFIDDIAYGFALTQPGAEITPQSYVLPLSFDFSSQCDMSGATAVVDFTVE